MRQTEYFGPLYRSRVIRTLGIAYIALVPLSVLAQVEKEAHRETSDASESAPTAFDQQVQRLQQQVQRLEKALEQQHQGAVAAPPKDTVGSMKDMPAGMKEDGGSKKSMGMMGGKMKMGMRMMGGMDGKMGMSQDKEPMPAGQKRGMGMMNGMKMMGMGGGKAMTAPKTVDPLPAFSGSPGIYHLGASGFYLDHADKIALTPEQQAALDQIQKEAMSQQAILDEQIAEADSQLGMLTGSDQPDAGRIASRIGDIERLRGDQRMAFIRAVGLAAAVLTDEQRKTLTAQPAGGENSAPTEVSPQS